MSVLLAVLLSFGLADAPLEYELRAPTAPVLLGEWFEIVVEGELPDSVGLFAPDDPGDALYGRVEAERRGAHRILRLPVSMAREGELQLSGLYLAGVDVEQELPAIDLEVVFERPTGFVPVVAEPAAALALPRPSALTWPFLVASLAGLLLLGTLTLLAGRRRVFERAPRPAHLVALEELARLRAHLPEDAESVRGMVAEVSLVLRGYIEARFELHAPARSTEEFLMELEGGARGDVLGDHRAELADFLMDCDLATYAGVRPGREGLLKLLASAEAFVETTLALSEAEEVDPDAPAPQEREP